ncbi:hypothetical protein [Vibrio phage BX-1]|nr:hypothetical protein [Vibrio phage BX-1]
MLYADKTCGFNIKYDCANNTQDGEVDLTFKGFVEAYPRYIPRKYLGNLIEINRDYYPLEKCLNILLHKIRIKWMAFTRRRTSNAST